MYDVIVVGARVAGSATAFLLARRGLRVLVLDRATFPSDTLSSHQIQPLGVARLANWGLLQGLEAKGTRPTRRLLFDPGPAVLEGRIPPHGPADAVYGPRRSRLDKHLVNAARAAGAEVRENVVVEALLTDDGMVTGVRCRQKKGSATYEVKTRLVVGADGKHSFVAKSVAAPRYRESPPLSTAYYAYWDGMTLDRAEIYNRERRAIAAWPTDDGLVLTYVAAPVAEFETFQRDPEKAMMAALDLVPDLGQRFRAARRVERMHGSRDLPNFFRKPFGPGWALVGDAGFVLDPVTAQGIGNGLRDSELLAEAIVASLGGAIPLDTALEGYQKARDEAALPMYEFTLDLVAFKPWKIEEAVTFQSLVGRPALTEQLFSVLTGSSPMSRFLRPRNILRILGVRGIGEVAYRRISRGLARRRARRLAARMPKRQEAA